ncbi:T6SS immunity protein Tli4 family protein [Pseudoduganella sp. OTU4001]|uniref:T6SS immunity protein Tli4 family protein n=1 Tax=Pseudoduganella sp. OTU4001 TaxID=3043854 RepID=UPI00313E961D
MLSKENRLSNVFSKTKKVCIGRFIVDIPETAEVVYGPARVPVEISRRPSEGANLHAAIEEAVRAVEERRWLALGELKSKSSLLGTVMEGIGPNQKLVFSIGRGDTAAYNIQSFVSAGNDLFLQEYEAYGKEDAYEAVRKAKEIASLLRYRSEEDIPAEDGICIDGAFLGEPANYMVEAVSLGIRLKEFDDVHMSIQMTKKDIRIESDALEPRIRAAEKDAIKGGHGHWYKRIKFLREGPRRIGGWDGFEIAARKPSQTHEEESHEFAYMSQGEPKNPFLPVLDVQLHTGVHDNKIGGTLPSISDDEAIYLWDKVLGSIRPRLVHDK